MCLVAQLIMHNAATGLSDKECGSYIGLGAGAGILPAVSRENWVPSEALYIQVRVGDPVVALKTRVLTAVGDYKGAVQAPLPLHCQEFLADDEACEMFLTAVVRDHTERGAYRLVEGVGALEGKDVRVVGQKAAGSANDLPTMGLQQSKQAKKEKKSSLRTSTRFS